MPYTNKNDIIKSIHYFDQIEKLIKKEFYIPQETKSQLVQDLNIHICYGYFHESIS